MRGAWRGALVVLCVASLAGAVPTPKPVAAVVPVAPDWPLRPGDVVLRGGSGLWSGVFARLNRHDTRFSHAGVVVRVDDSWHVVHVLADDLGRNGRVQREPWADYARAPRLAVLRVDDAAAGARMARAAADMLAQGAGFDFDFDLTDAQRVYCTELVWRALREALGEDPLSDKPRVNGRPAVLVENLLHDIPALRLVRIAGRGGS